MANQHKKKKAMLALAMVIFGTLGPLTRRIAVTSGELALYRAVLAVALIGGYLAVTRRRLDVKANKKEAGLLLLAGMALGCDWMLLFEAYRHTTIAVATLCACFAPVIVTILCPLVFRERMSRKQLLCFCMSTVGLVLIIGAGAGSPGSADLLGILCGIGSACFYVAVILINKWVRRIAGIQSTFIQFLGVILVLTPYVLGTGGVHLEVLDAAGWVCLLIVGLFHTGFTYCLYFTAIQGLEGSETAILTYLDPVVAILVSFFLLGEAMTLPQLLGGALILGFTWWNERDVK